MNDLMDETKIFTEDSTVTVTIADLARIMCSCAARQAFPDLQNPQFNDYVDREFSRFVQAAKVAAVGYGLQTKHRG